MYEYVADSEEASASQTESVVSTSSMDDGEFQTRTQRFLENMEKLRQEIREDTETQDYEEELVEELEIEEQGFEETVQMADVKWQYQQRVTTEIIRLSPEKTEDYVDAPATEHLQEGTMTSVETAVASRPRREVTRVMVVTEAQAVEGASELVSEGAETTQHQEVRRCYY